MTDQKDLTDRMTENLPAPLKTLSRAQQSNVVNIVRRAARSEILPRFRRLVAADVSPKSHAADLVALADVQAEAMMTRALQIAFPQALVIGEEAISADPTLLDGLADAPLAFVIDPVDGTWNFTHNLAVFGVIVAALQFGKPVFGLIYDPMADDWAIADLEATPELQRGFGPAIPLKAAMGRSLDRLSGYVPLHLFPVEHRAAVTATLPGFAWTGTLHCSAHEYRMIAQGNVDFMINASLHPWDHAAGALICQAAGCHVEMLGGGAYHAGLREGYLMVAPDRVTWNRLAKVFGFLMV